MTRMVCSIPERRGKRCCEKKRMNILLLIKDSALLTAMAMTLERRDYRVVRTAASDEALPLASTTYISNYIDMLVVSLNVPPEGAEPIVQAFRAKNPRLPVLLVAGSFSQQDRKRVEKMRSTCWCTGDVSNFWLAMERALKYSPSD